MTNLITLVIIVLAMLLAAYGSLTSNKNMKVPTKKVNLFYETKGQLNGNHADRIGNHLIEHPKAEPGYIVLNGIKRKLEDCKDL